MTAFLCAVASFDCEVSVKNRNQLIGSVCKSVCVLCVDVVQLVMMTCAVDPAFSSMVHIVNSLMLPTPAAEKACECPISSELQLCEAMQRQFLLIEYIVAWFR